MKTTEKYDFGVSCGDPELLKKRVLVSGLRLMTPSEAFSNGFGKRNVIVPTEERGATDEEIERIVAKPDTKHVAKIVKVAAGIGRRVTGIVRQTPDFRLDMTTEPTDFGHGIVGFPGGIQSAKRGMSNVTRDQEELLVGDHINTTPEPDMRAAIINNGPGSQYVRVTPSSLITAQSFNGEVPGQRARNDRMRELLENGRASELLSYAFRIDPLAHDITTGHVMTEAFVELPVTQYLYDGATGLEASSAAFVVSPPGQNPWEHYASVV